MILSRRDDGCSEVLPAWGDDLVVCIGGGASLTREQVDSVSGRARVIAINNAYLLAPWADVLYFADGIDKFYGWHHERPEFREFRGEVCTIDPARGVDRERVHVLRNDGVEGLSSDATALRNGRNAGYQAINLAVLAGAKRIVLLGYDMRHQNGKAHWFGDHPIPTPERDLVSYRQRFSTMEQPLRAIGVEVVNASPGSALETFPRVPLDLVRWFQEPVEA